MKISKQQAVLLVSSFVFTLIFLHFFRFFSLDDAAIYQRMIGNALNFGHYTYNLDRPINAGTSMLYPFLVMPFALIFKSYSLHTVSVALDGVLLFFAAFFLSNYILRSTKNLPLAMLSSSLALILPVGDLLGMETALLLFFFGSYLNFFNHSHVRYVLTALFPLVRPECAVFWGVEGLIRLQSQKFKARAWIPATISCLPLLLPALLAMIYNYLSFGAPLPQSVTNKMEQGVGGFELYFSHLKNIVRATPHSVTQQIVLIFVLLGIVPFLKNKLLSFHAFFVGIFVWQVTIVFLKVPNYSWYAVPLFYFLGLSFVFGLGFSVQFLEKFLNRKFLVFVNPVLCVLVFLFSWKSFFPSEIRYPESRQHVQFETGKFIMAQGDQNPVTVAALEVGHIGNALPGDRYSVYDLCGLTSKNSGFFQPNFRSELFCERQPEYLTVNYFSKLGLSDVKSVQTKGDSFSVERYLATGNHGKVWPHLTGMVIDRNFSRGYRFLENVEVPGYPGGLAIFRRVEGFSCTDPDPLSIESVSASAENSSSQLIIDGNLSTIWNARDFAPQSTSFTFPSVHSLKRIDLYPNSDKSSSMNLRFRFIDEMGAELKLLTVPIEFNDGDVLSVTFDEIKAKSVEISFEGGESWLALREVSFFSQ